MPASVFHKEFVTSAKGRYKCRVMNADGSVAFAHDKWLPNLILDSGLDKVAYMPWAQTFQFCVAGTGTTPTKVITASQASQTGTTVTINVGSYAFAPSVVGKLLFWPATESYAKIIAYTNTTTVTVDRSQSVAQAAFDVYNVDQTALVTPYSMNMRYQVGEGMCGTDLIGDTVTMYRTFDFYIESSPVQITELGFKDTPKASSLFSRVLLPDPVFLSSGQWLQVSYQLSIVLSPSTPNGKSPTVVGWPVAPAATTTGSEQIQLYGLCVVDANGLARPYDRSQLCNEPYAPGSNYLGPQFGYVNRWGNGAGSPIKLYARADRNPFTNPRNQPTKFQVATTGSYIPLSVSVGTMQLTIGATGTLSYTGSQSTSDYIWTSADIGSVVKWGSTYHRITGVNSASSVSVTPGSTGTGSPPSAATFLYFRSGNGSTGQWFGEIENASDMMQPLVAPPDTPQVHRVGGTTPGWNGVDPQTEFPNSVPYLGESPWDNWTVDLTPTAAIPTTVTLTAVSENFVTPTYQWQVFTDNTVWEDVQGATASTLQVPASDIFLISDPTVFSGSKQYRVILDSDDPDTDQGSVGYFTIHAFRQNPALPTYYVVLSNPKPAIRRTTTVPLNGDQGSGGRVVTEVRVYRDITELSVLAYSPSSFPGPGRFSFTESDAAVSTQANIAYFNGSAISAGPTFTIPLSIKIETSTQTTVNWIVRVINGASAATPVVDVEASAPAILVGGGVQDVTGSSAFISEATDAPATIGTCVDRSVARHVEIPLTLASYTPGTFTRFKQATFQTNMANGTNWRTLGIGGMDPDTQVINRVNASKFNGYVFVFDEAQTKIRLNYLTVQFQYTWNRDLGA